MQRLIDANRLLSEDMKTKYYHLPNGDIAIPIIDIEHAPTVPAVPLEMISKKLGSLCKPCISQTIGCPYKSFDCDSCNTRDAWEKAIRKWMEEEDAQKEN